MEHVRTRVLANLVNVDPDLAKRIADGLAMPLPKAAPTAAPVQDFDLSPALRLVRGPLELDTLEGRKIGILIADGTDAGALDSLVAAIGKGGGVPFIVAPKVGGTKLSNGKAVKADGQLAGSPSVLFDAVAVLLSAEGCTLLLKEGAAVQFVMDAFVHLKAIGYSMEALPLLDKAGVEPDDGVVAVDAFVDAAGRRYWDREPKVRLLA